MLMELRKLKTILKFISIIGRYDGIVFNSFNSPSLL